MKVDLAGQVALVTGAARGIGKAIADVFAANGARVLYTDIDLATVTASAAATGNRAAALDVTNAAQGEEVIAGSTTPASTRWRTGCRSTSSRSRSGSASSTWTCTACSWSAGPGRG
jgi:hypothetical protein